jgi:hypothetical protein
LDQYFYLIIYIIKPPYEQVLVGMGVDHGWAQRNKRKKKEMAQEMRVPWARENKNKNKKTKKMPRRQLSPGPIPSSLVVSPPPRLL